MNGRLINETDNFVRLKDIEERFYRLPLNASDYRKLLEHFEYLKKTDMGYMPTDKSIAIGCDHHKEASNDGVIFREYVTWSVLIYSEVERLLEILGEQ